ncbi:MAG: nucleoside-diphosphate kinase [Nitrospinota bacterium]
MSQTLALIKPDAVARNLIGKIIDRIESNNFKIVAMKLLKLSKDEAEQFYIVHKSRPFYGELTDYMSSGELVAMVIEKANAQEDWRTLIGATNPKEAKAGTLRNEFAIDVEKNSLHGSDSDENAQIEIAYFFSKLELVDRG